MLALGVDPGLAALGFGLLAWEQKLPIPVAVGTARTEFDLELQPRIAKLYHALADLRSDVVGMEDQERTWAAKQALGHTNADAVKVRVVEGLIRTLAAAWAVPLIVVTPQQIRSALGLPGNAPKKQVRGMVRRLVRGLPAVMSEHACDAVAIAVAVGGRLSVQLRFEQQRRNP